MRRLASAVIVLIVTMVALPAGQAATRTWQGAGGSASFNVAGNWGAGGVPGTLDTAAFTGATTTTCNITASATVAAVTVSGNATLALTAGQTLTVTGDYTQTTNTPTVAISGGILNVTGAFNQSAGSFTQSSGTLLLDSASVGAKNLTTHSASFFNLAINDGLLAYWKLDESATPSIDSSGWGRNAAWTSTATSSATVGATNFTNPRSLSIPATDSAAVFTTPATSVITIAVWVKATAQGGGSNQRILEMPGYLLYFNAAGLTAPDNPMAVGFTGAHVSGGDGQWRSPANSISYGTWYHVAVTYDSSSTSNVPIFYINGVARTATALTSPANAATNNAGTGYIGNRLNGGSLMYDRYWNGLIDELRIYNRLLSADEINSLYIGNQPGTGNGTLTLTGSPTVSNDLTLATGTLSVGGGNLTVSGSWNNYGGIFTAGSSTVTLNSTGSEVIRSAGQPFNNLTLSGSGATWTLEDWLKVDSALTMTNGALSPGAYAVHVGDLTKTSGTLTAGTGTVVIDTTTAPAGNGSGFGLTFNNLRIETPDETNLVGYWKFDEGQGTTIGDASGAGHDGTLNGSANWVAGASNLPSAIDFDNHAALGFNGTTAYGSLPVTGQPAASAAKTVAMWVNLSSTAGTQDFFSILNSTPGTVYVIGVRSGTIAALRGGGVVLASVAAPSTGSWHHVAYTYDGVNAHTMYLDGTTVGTGSNALTGNNATVWIGSREGSTEMYSGKLDDLRVYSVALTAAQVQNLVAGGYAGTGSGATVTLGANLTVNNTLAIDSGTLATSTFTVNAAATDSTKTATVNAGTLQVGSNTVTFNGGLTVGAQGTVTENTAGGAIALATGEALEYDEPSGAAVGFPTAAFDWNSFTFWREYVTYSSYVGATTADTVLALTADGGTKYSWQLPSSKGSLLGTPRWNTEGTMPAVHYIYLITTLGYVYKVLDDGTALTTVSGWPYRNLASPGTNATASSPLANDSTNLYWSGKDGANNSQIFSLTMATQALTTLSVSSTLSAAPALATVSGTNYVFFPIGSQAYQVPSPAFGSSTTNSATNTINGRITVYNNIVYFPEAYGFVYALTATNTGAAATALTGWPYQDRTSTGHTGAGCATSHQCPAVSNIYVDIGQNRLCFGDADGHIYVLPSSGTPTPLTGFPWQITSGDVISVAPLSRNGVLLVGATNGTNYKVYEIDETNGTTRALTRTWTFPAAVSSISYNPSASGGNGAYTVGTSDGKLFYINAATDPTPSQR